MTRPIQSGYLLIADISGFTSYVAGAELDHGQAILQQVLAGLIDSLTPAMDLCEVEGDAVFVYAPDRRLPRGELVAELVESAYAAFRDQQRTMIHNATCPCRACSHIGDLDLKVVVHHGDFVIQELAGKTGPVGSAVNLAHRLLKNRVEEDTGWRAYALYTADALGRMGLPADDMHAGMEQHEHLGITRTYSMDLRHRYQALSDCRRIVLDADDAHLEVRRRIDAPRPVVWDWLADVAKRTRWMRRSDWVADYRPAGRTGPQATNHCATYNAIEHVLDWRPFDSYTVRFTSSGLDVLSTVRLEPDGGGTLLIWRMKVELPLPRRLLEKIAGMLASRRMQLEPSLDDMMHLIRADAHEAGGVEKVE